MPCASTPIPANCSRPKIDGFINDRWLLTVRKGDGFDLDGVLQRVDRSSDLLTHGVSVLLYALLDVVVDGYFEAISGFDEYYDLNADDIFAEKPTKPSRQRHWLGGAADPQPHAREHFVISGDMYPYSKTTTTTS